MTDAMPARSAAPGPARAFGLGRLIATVAAALTSAAILVVGCWHSSPTAPAEPTGPPWFVDATDEVGLHFVHDAGPAGAYFMPQLMGSGAALFDFDNDGLLDLYLIQNGGP